MTEVVVQCLVVLLPTGQNDKKLHCRSFFLCGNSGGNSGGDATATHITHTRRAVQQIRAQLH